MPGRQLAALLLAPEASIREKMDGLTWAADGLRRLHGCDIIRSTATIPLSHGDATVQNVLVDQATQRVYWIDFDTRHDLRTTVVWRQADDLRALCFSAASVLPAEHHHDAVAVILSGYGRQEIVRMLQTWSRQAWLSRDLYHRAQAALGVDCHTEVQALLAVM